ncbi:MAG: Uma2 family endonuclease, partial [Tolypothrix sp. Co-bin9]|nr:Uma2 family endonuclease [Tolypothrix sp. Co-bin9]
MTASVERGLNKIPPLESGDRLSRHEFERRYTAMPHLKKAELIEGVVYVSSPLRFKSHGQPHGDLIIWLGTYKVSTPGVELGDNATVRLDLDNEPQPDVLL